MAEAGFHSIAKLRAQRLNPVLEDHGVFQADCRRVRIRPESGGWQSAEHWKADCQGDNIVVAVRGIRARGLAMEWNPAPAILHREAPCLNCHIFLKSDFTSLKLIRGVLFRPKLHVNGLSKSSAKNFVSSHVD
jgi:hypothetical protein